MANSDTNSILNTRNGYSTKYEFGGGIGPMTDNGEVCIIVRLETPKANVQVTNGFDGLVAARATAQISKNVKPLYEIGTVKYYMVDGRPSGGGTIQHSVGVGTKNVITNLRDFADVCTPTKLIMGALDNCACKYTTNGAGGGTMEFGKETTFTFVGGFLTGISASITSEQWIMTDELTFAFIDVEAPVNKDNA